MASERMTSINLPGTGSWCGGFADWGIIPPAQMIKEHRARAVALKRDAEAVIAAADDDFKIATYRGVYVKRDYKVIQAGRNPTV